METLFEIHQKGLYNKIYVENDTINSIYMKNQQVIHKQIERRNGFTYMRIKKRDLDVLN